MSLIDIDNVLVEAGAEEMRQLGFKVFELRKHGDTLRIVLGARELESVLTPDIGRALAARLKPLGYKYVALDLEPLEDSWNRT